MSKCPNCGRNTLKTIFNADIAESFTWCTYCAWEPDYDDEEYGCDADGFDWDEGADGTGQT